MADINSKNLQWNNPLGGLPLDNGLYKATTDQKFHYSSRIIHPIDGRMFRYCGSKAALYSGYGAPSMLDVDYIIGAVLPAGIAIGTQKRIAVTIASGDGYAGNGAIAEDELVGGYVVMGHGAENLTQNRLIIKNTAVAANGGTCYIDVDGAIEETMTISSSYCEILLNPYQYLGFGGEANYVAFMCVPTKKISGSGYSFWGQTRGPCWVVPGGGDTSPGDTANDRIAYFVGDGSVNFGTSLSGGSLASHVPHQKAGWCMDPTKSGTSAMPLIFLEIE